MLAIRQSPNFFKKYKNSLYDALVGLIIAMNMHRQIFFIWIRKFVEVGLAESLRIPEGTLYMSVEDFFAKLLVAHELWRGMVQRSLWTEFALGEFLSAFLDHCNALVQQLDLSYRLQSPAERGPEEGES